jgi:hypothetical protein
MNYARKHSVYIDIAIEDRIEEFTSNESESKIIFRFFESYSGRCELSTSAFILHFG